MQLLQLLSDATSGGLSDLLLVGSGGAGAMILQKILEYFKPKQDRSAKNNEIVQGQVNLLNGVIENLEGVVTKLQDVACFRDKCKERLNGEELTK